MGNSRPHLASQMIKENANKESNNVHRSPLPEHRDVWPAACPWPRLSCHADPYPLKPGAPHTASSLKSLPVRGQFTAAADTVNAPQISAQTQLRTVLAKDSACLGSHHGLALRFLVADSTWLEQPGATVSPPTARKGGGELERRQRVLPG